MRREVDPLVTKWLDEENLKQKHPSLTALLQKLGIEIANEKDTLYAWAWRRSYEPKHIVTIWAEDIHVGQDGRWEVETSLVASGNPRFNEDQRKRESDRISILKELSTQGLNCRAILMVNRFSREQEAMGKSANAELRVLDDEDWHVEDRGTFPIVMLRRGSRPARDDAAGLDEGPEEHGENVALQFPDPETRRRVEVAAIEYAKREYASQGHVTSVEADNCGYDLKVTDPRSGETKLKVEVKGTSGDEETFYLTRNEYNVAKQDRAKWRLAIVVNALSNPTLQEYRVAEMERAFHMHALAWRCVPRKDQD